MDTAKLALKPYLEKIEQLCAPLDKESLTRLILDLARQAAVAERGDFLGSILANKQRGAYDRAAQVLAALAEDMTAAGKKKEAQALLQDYCKVRYNRHVAFRKEVREAVGKSIILRGMAAGL